MINPEVVDVPMLDDASKINEKLAGNPSEATLNQNQTKIVDQVKRVPNCKISIPIVIGSIAQ